MNKAILMGRLTKDPELKSTANGISVCTFTVAVDRRFKNANGEREADFIPIVAWRQTAEFIARYFQKGQRIALVGSIQVRSWEDNGNRRYITEVIAEEAYFADSKSEGNNYNRSNAYQNQNTNTSGASKNDSANDFPDDFFSAPDDETALPFDL